LLVWQIIVTLPIKMKKKVLFIIAALIPLFASAQYIETQPQKTDCMFVADLGYEHSMSNGHMALSQMRIKWDAARWFRMIGGLKVTTKNIYYFTVRGDFKLPIDETKYVGLRNQYIYDIMANKKQLSTMDINMSLAADYSMNYLYVATGVMWNYKMPLVSEQAENIDGLGWHCSWIYEVLLWARPKKADWNIGAEVSNMHSFSINDWKCPTFTLRGTHTIMPKYGTLPFNIIWEAECKTAYADGTLNYSGANAKIGIECYF